MKGHRIVLCLITATLIFNTALLDFGAKGADGPLSPAIVANITSSGADIVLFTESWPLDLDYTSKSGETGTKDMDLKSKTGIYLVDLWGLQPSTLYEYRLSSGSKTVQSGEFETVNVSFSSPSHTIYGQVKLSDGTLGDGAAVVAWIVTPSQTSMPLASRIEQGYWLIDLSNAVGRDGGRLVWDTGDTIELKCYGGTWGDAEKSLEIESTEDQDCGIMHLRGPKEEDGEMPVMKIASIVLVVIFIAIPIAILLIKKKEELRK